MYRGTAILGDSTADTFCYLNALETTGSAATTGDVVPSTGITLSANLLRNGRVTVTGVVVTVKDKNGATVAAIFTLSKGTKHNQTANTGNTGNTTPCAKSGRGNYALTVTKVAKNGYPFDPANS